jgi:hypothetical protein
MTIIPNLLAAGSHILSRLRPTSKPLSDTFTFLLLTSSYVFGILSISNLFSESWAGESHRSGIMNGVHIFNDQNYIYCYSRAPAVYYLTLVALLVLVIVGIFASRGLRNQIQESGSSISYLGVYFRLSPALKMNAALKIWRETFFRFA